MPDSWRGRRWACTERSRGPWPAGRRPGRAGDHADKARAGLGADRERHDPAISERKPRGVRGVQTDGVIMPGMLECTGTPSSTCSPVGADEDLRERYSWRGSKPGGARRSAQNALIPSCPRAQGRYAEIGPVGGVTRSREPAGRPRLRESRCATWTARSRRAAGSVSHRPAACRTRGAARSCRRCSTPRSQGGGCLLPAPRRGHARQRAVAEGVRAPRRARGAHLSDGEHRRDRDDSREFGDAKEAGRGLCRGRPT